MKIIVIGDIHGRVLWISIIEKEKDVDKVIFMGDYFDSRDGITAEDQIINFQNIVDWRRARILAGFEDVNLIGNHDYHYLDVCDDPPYSNYQKMHTESINEILEANKDILQMAHSEGSCLFTHAGVGVYWLAENSGSGINDLTSESIAKHVNTVFKENPGAFKFTPGPTNSRSGDDITQTPIWIRPQSLGKSMMRGIKQVVGHTGVIKITSFPDMLADTSITLVDALEASQYLIITDGIMSIGQM